MMKRKTRIFLILALSGVVIFNERVFAFQKTSTLKEIVVERFFAEDSPVDVDGVIIAGKVFKLGTKFENDGSWLQHLSIGLKNNAKKTVTFVELFLDFPETKSNETVMAFPLRFGRSPHSRAPLGEAALLASGATTEIALSQPEYLRLKKFLEERFPVESITKARVRITEIGFYDGLIWINGSWFKRDPHNTNRFIPADSNSPD
jgi:hypothetical protein